MILLSSKATAKISEVTKLRQGREKKTMKPEVILDYNKYMGGVDSSDMMLYVYLDERKTLKYWKKVAFNIIGRMVLNSYIIYKENFKEPGKPLTRLMYTISVIENLGAEWLNFREESEVRGRISPGIRKLGGRKEYRCCVCSTKEQRRRSRTVCVRCNRGLHGECLHKHKC